MPRAGLINDGGYKMKKTELNKVKSKLTILKEQPFNEISRAGSMLCLGFGDKIKTQTAYKTDSGAFGVKQSQKSKYALHIDGFFRIRVNNKILLTQNDMFEPSSVAVEDNDFKKETFPLDAKGNNRFDEQLTDVFDFKNQVLSANEIKVNELGDLNITLSNGYVIDVFVDTSVSEECWRFFEVGNAETPHIVIKGCEYYEE